MPLTAPAARSAPVAGSGGAQGNGWHEGGGGRRHTRRGAAPDVNPCLRRGGPYSGMPGWLTTVSGTTLWVIRVTPMANWQWTGPAALVFTRAGSQDRSHAGQSVAVAPRRGGMAGTGRGAFYYLLLEYWVWTCPVPGPRPTGGQPLAHPGVSGETHAVVTGKYHAMGLDAWTACGN